MARAVGWALRPPLERMESRVLLSTTNPYVINTIGYFGANEGGGNPRSALIADAKGNLYGTTSAGGLYGAGAVFEIANDGLNKITTLVSFNGVHGRLPYAGLTMDAQGNLFGTTYQGGDKDDGTVFEIAKGPYPVLTTLASFTGTSNITTHFIGNGAHPVAGVTLDAAGNLFGTADDGGDKGFGTVWEITKGSNTITALASFTGGTEAARPNGNVIFDGSGNLLGTTYLGGTHGDGTVFELPAGLSAITTLASFSGTDGKTPDAGLTLDGAGNLFGTTFGGGDNNAGTVFEVGAGTNAITTLASFNADDGSNPYGGVIVGSSGNLYGTTESGGLKPDGTKANGTVFEIAPGSNVITTLVTFVGTNGSTPYASLLQDASGNLLGTTYLGGDNGAGTVFEIPGGSTSLTTIASFAEVGSSISPATEGVTVDATGNVFGMTPYGGTFNQGTIYEIAAGTATFTTLASFDGTKTGAQPDGTMAIDAKGNLFGTASAGGANGVGTVFELPSGSNKITALASFDATNNGASTPNAGVTMDALGNLYGTTTFGGANGDGTIFELPASATSVQTLASFDVTKDGANPYSGVIEDSGNLYGTIVGGPDPAGIVYEVVAGSGAITPAATFSSDNGQYLNGQYPDAGVIDVSGTLYGTAYMGGTDNLGTVFRVDSGKAIAIASFKLDSTGVSADGQNPHSNLTLDASGNLWGTTYQGGADGDGTIFEITAPTSSSAALSTIATFNGPNGANPYTGMAMDASGNFYGTTEFGGVIGGGTVFELSTHSVVTLTPEPTTPNPAPGDQALSYIVNLADAVPDGETVTIEDTSNNNIVVATGTLSSDTTVLTIPPNTLADGTHNLVAVYAGDGTFPPGQSLPYAQVINGAAAPALVGNPLINGDDPNGLFNAPGQGSTPGVQRSMVEDVVYTFNEAVTIPDANKAFTVQVAGSMGTVPTTLFAQAVTGSGGTQWAVSLTGQAEGTLASIANGEYSITINPAFVFAASDGTTAMTTGETDTFYRLYGDINGDRIVNNADNLQFRRAQVTYNPALDANSDGFINNADNLQLRRSQAINFFSDGFVTTI